MEVEELQSQKKYTICDTYNSFERPTRMRIQMQEGSFETDPCATFTNGEVEDYTIDISSNVASIVQTNASVRQTNSYCTSRGNNTTHEN